MYTRTCACLDRRTLRVTISSALRMAREAWGFARWTYEVRVWARHEVTLARIVLVDPVTSEVVDVIE